MSCKKILIGKLSSLAHEIFTNGCSYPYHSISATWATTNKPMLLYPGCVNKPKYDYIMDRISNKVGVFTQCLSTWDKVCSLDNLQNTIFTQFAITIHA